MLDIDKELAEVEQMSGDVMHEPGEKPEETPEEPPKETPKEEAPEAPKEEPKADPVPSQEKKEEEPKVEKKPEEPTKRPERYIPLPKYQDEKNAWRSEKADLEKQLAEAQQHAETAKGENITGQEKAEVAEDAVRKYAEEHGFDEKQVADLVSVVASSVIPPEVRDLINKQAESAKEAEAEQADREHFDGQWKGVESDLRKQYPEATEAQIAEAKKLMDQMSHTEATAQTPLKYLLAGERDAFDEVFGKPSYTFDGARTGTAQRTVTAKDFKDGATSFDVLGKMPEGERKAIVRDMDLSTYDAYMKHVLSSDDIMEVRRDGKLV